MKIFLVAVLASIVVFQFSCGTAASYTIVKFDNPVECSCDRIIESITYFKKSYKSDKSIETYGAIMIPIEKVRGEDYIHQEFNTLNQCLDTEFKQSDDGYYMLISEEQWNYLKSYTCTED